jgi:hypothetical protein
MPTSPYFTSEFQLSLLKRRTFIAQGSVLATGFHLRKLLPGSSDYFDTDRSLYPVFKSPPNIYRPFVRWWWNGDRIEKNELARQLRLLKEAGIGGVEINPIKFPARTDNIGKRAVEWLSDEWIELLKFACNEAKSLGLVCDLIVGSGWPFGAEWLEGEERSQVMVVGTKKLEGPLDYEVSIFELFKEADPPISSPFAGRKMEMISVTLAPSVINDHVDIKDLSAQIASGTIRYKIPEGKFVLYAMVKIHGFMEVIQGAPGATGPVLNHYNKAAVEKYLGNMSETIQQRVGPLSAHIHSLFTDSLELEGANWCEDMQDEFKKRRGYDLVPVLPYVLYKIAGMGNTWIYDHGAEFSPGFRNRIQRVRYDFELTKAELIKERFVDVFVKWCRDNKVQSRMQAYGRGYFPLEGSFAPDIPECETWIRPGLGIEMSDTDYRVGRAYTVVNKYVSSAAHLQGKKLVSCEELTNIHQVFNETLELMKVAGDQSIISGATHPIFHGFNYSPLGAAFPGWVIYGTFINERNGWWPYFNYFTEYKTRLSALLQKTTQFADIAILPATADLWSQFSAQNDPFPAVMYPEWQTLVWESIHQNGCGCDYISEKIILDSTIQRGYLLYNQRMYHTVCLTGVETIEPSVVERLIEFIESGGKIFFIGSYPSRATGWNDHEERDKKVQELVNKMKEFSDRCFLVGKPGQDHTAWFKNLQKKYGINPYVVIDSPNRFVSQVAYETKDSAVVLFVNSNMNEGYEMEVTPSSKFSSKRQAWIWDAETGERYRLPASGSIRLNLGPADLKIIVFDKEKKGNPFLTTRKDAGQPVRLTNRWLVTGTHIDGKVVQTEMDELRDLKDIDEWINFYGNIVYKTNLVIEDKAKFSWMDLGKVFGVCELLINGETAGVRWYGKRVYPVGKFIRNGKNAIEVKVTTTAGNYLKSLKDNAVGQYWTNQGRTIQPIQSIGLAGPVTIY